MTTTPDARIPSVPPVPALTLHWLTPDTGSDLLVVGPSLGTGVVALWERCAMLLSADAGVDVLGWDLPGHGDGQATAEPFRLGELADAVLAAVEAVRPGAVFAHAGVSVGGATGLHLALGARPRVRASAVICSGAKLGTPQAWAERAATVRAQGTTVMVEGSRQRWFAPGFTEREPDTAQLLLDTLTQADGESYAQVCGALGEHDVRTRLGSIGIPVLVLGGIADEVCPPESQTELAAAIPGARLEILEGAAHLAPAEAPQETARVLAEWLGTA